MKLAAGVEMTIVWPVIVSPRTSYHNVGAVVLVGGLFSDGAA